MCLRSQKLLRAAMYGSLKFKGKRYPIQLRQAPGDAGVSLEIAEEHRVAEDAEMEVARAN